MGSGSSRPTAGAQHVFTSESPMRFSQQVVDALQTSPETDATRASDLELHIQNRVKQELKRLESEQNKALKELHEKLQEPESNKSSTPKDKPDLGRQTVQKEIDELRKRLSQRRLKEEIASDKAVEKAKDEMVTCLRMNDRRPLDCWKEVDAFKSEVARLERQFIGKVLE